jgi:hypothetical protein
MKVGTSGTKVGGPMLQVVSLVNLLLARFLDVASKLSPQALVSIQLIHCRKR